MLSDDGYFRITGEALDVDSLFRIRDHLVAQSIDEMLERGVVPIEVTPEVDFVANSIGRIDFTFRWKVSEFGV